MVLPHRMTVSSYLIDRLHQAGVRHLFSVPGDYVCGFLDTLEHGGRIARVGNCNEMNAGYAADAYARIAGVGAVVVTYGVGAFSLLNTIAGAYVERLPVIVINGSPTMDERRQERATGLLYHHSTGDLFADLEVYRHVTVAAELLDDAARAPAQIDAAITAALLHKRPIYLEVTEDLWDRPCAPPTGQLASALSPTVGAAALEAAHRTMAGLKGGLRAVPANTEGPALDEAVAAILATLQRAGTPVIWGGLEVHRFHLHDQFEQLVDRTGYPWTTTLSGKAILAETHPRFRGVYDGKSAPAALRRLIEEADCVLGLGAWLTDEDLGDVAPNWETLILANHDAVQVNGRTYQPVRLADLLAALLARLPAAPAGRQQTAPASLREPRAGALPPRTRLSYQTFFERLDTFIDATMTVLVDTGIGLFCAAELTIPRRGGFIAQAVWGSIGYTIGAALGASFADPARRPLVVVGDGSFQMTCQELTTMARHGQKPIVCVLDNGIYGVEQAVHDPKPFFIPLLPFAGYNQLARWDYQHLATAFGGWSRVVETVEDLDQALAYARDRAGAFSLIQVKIPQRDLPEQLLRRGGPLAEFVKHAEDAIVP